MNTIDAEKNNDEDMPELKEFSKGVPNPYYTKYPKKTVTIRLDTYVLDYFKKMAKRSHIPYQTLINFCLHDCAKTHHFENTYGGAYAIPDESEEREEAH